MSSVGWIPRVASLVVVGALLASGLILPIEAQTTIELQAPSTVGPGQAFTAKISGIANHLGTSVATNGDFSQGLQNWTFGGNGEIGSGGTASVREADIQSQPNPLVLEATNPSKTGTLYVYQKLPVVAGTSYQLGYLGANLDSTKSEVRIIVRQKSGSGPTSDTTFTHGLSSVWTPYTWTWTPKISDAYATLFLRILVNASTQARVGFDDVRFQPLPTTEWTAPDAVFASRQGSSATLLYETPGSHPLTSRGWRDGAKLWEVTKNILVKNQDPQAHVRTASGLTTNTWTTFDASASFDPDTKNDFADPKFADMKTNWRPTANEVAAARFLPESRTDLDGGAAVLRVENTTKGGSVYLHQTFPVYVLQNWSLSVRVRDTGPLAEYAFIFREKDAAGASADTVRKFPASPGQWRLVTAEWQPKLERPTSVQIFLRAIVPANSTSQVEFAQPSLHRGLTFEWSLDGKPLPTTATPTQRAIIRQVGEHRVQVRVRDAHGATSENSTRFQVTAPNVDWAPDYPSLAPLGIESSFSLGRTQRHDDEQVRNGDFRLATSSWSFNAGEVGGNGSALVETTPTNSHVRFLANASKAGTVYLSQNIPEPCVETACRFQVDYRSPDAPLAMLLRSHYTGTDGKAATKDLIIKAPPTPSWTRHSSAFQTTITNATSLTIYLRIALQPNQSAVADFDNVSLTPELQAQWSTGTSRQAGDASDHGTAQIVFTRPGRHTVHLSLTDPWGITSRWQTNVSVAPIHLFKTLGGGVGIQWSQVPADPMKIEIIAANGTRLWNHTLGGPLAPTTDGTFRVQTTSDGNSLLIEALSLSQPQGARLRFSNSTGSGLFHFPWNQNETQRSELLTAHVEATNVGPVTRIRLELGTQDVSVRNIQARVRDSSGLVAHERLSRTDAGFEGTLSLPLNLRPGEYWLEYVVEDEWGRTTTLSNPAKLKLAPQNSLWSFLGVLGVAAAFIGAGIRIRQNRLRPRGLSRATAAGAQAWQSIRGSSTSSQASSSSSPARSYGRWNGDSHSGGSASTGYQSSSSASSSFTWRASPTIQSSSSSASRPSSARPPPRSFGTSSQTPRPSKPLAAPRRSSTASRSASPPLIIAGGSHHSRS